MTDQPKVRHRVNGYSIQVVLGGAADGFAEAARLPWVSGGQRVLLPKEITGPRLGQSRGCPNETVLQAEAIAMVFQELSITIWWRCRQDTFMKIKNSLQ
jgi:hypothetical protein